MRANQWRSNGDWGLKTLRGKCDVIFSNIYTNTTKLMLQLSYLYVQTDFTPSAGVSASRPQLTHPPYPIEKSWLRHCCELLTIVHTFAVVQQNNKNDLRVHNHWDVKLISS